MKAWLLTWEGTTGPAVIQDRKIIAILSSQRSYESIADIVDVLYSRCVDSADGMAFLANKRKQRQRERCQSISGGGRLFYGHNPCIFARQVKDLRIELDDDSRSEVVRWREIPVYQNDPLGDGIIERYPAEDRAHRRSIRPLSFDLYGNEP